MDGSGIGVGAVDPGITAPAEIEQADTRFRTLVGHEAWSRLPGPVRRRFSKRIPPGTMVLYEGEVVVTELNLAGRVLACFARIIGGPLPLDDGATGPSIVSVTEAEGGAGQTWLRTYTRSGRAPQIVRSEKRFRGETGLEEHVGGGIGMSLSVTVENGTLVFRSAHYFASLGRLRVRLPLVLAPGTMEIVHREEGQGRFSFRLTLTHPLFGRLIHQLAYFEEGRPCPAP